MGAAGRRPRCSASNPAKTSKQGADRVVTEIADRGGKAISEAKEAFGRLDILVNNAGAYEFAPLEAVTEELFHEHFNVNVLGLLLVGSPGTELEFAL